MDLIIFFNTLFGFFTFVAWAICLLILFFIFTKKRFSKVINDQFYNFATLVAIVCSIGSLVYSEVVGFIPCKFCWYQRYLMYPIALILIIGLFNKRFIPQHKQLLKSLSLEKTKAVCVVFADLDFDINLIEDIIKCGYQGVMIDTHNKTDKSLIEILPIDIIKRFVKIIRKSKRICGLSGSLKLKHISILKDLSPDFVIFPS